MSLFITSLNSGSNGNCYYIGSQDEGVLVDVGISCREIEIRMSRLGLALNNVKAIFISHEHADHIVGLAVTAKKYQVPVYITERTLKSSKVKIEKKLANVFLPYASINVGKLSVTAFPKNHDASDPHSFVVKYDSVCVGIFTDIGVACEQVVHHFKQCNAAFLEANYDEAMLMAGKYPYFLKNRIKGGQGHLSNEQAYRLFTQHRSPDLSHLILSHLSKENNCPELVAGLFGKNSLNTEIVVASRYKETPLYQISGSVIKAAVSSRMLRKEGQLSLF